MPEVEINCRPFADALNAYPRTAVPDDGAYSRLLWARRQWALSQPDGLLADVKRLTLEWLQGSYGYQGDTLVPGFANTCDACPIAATLRRAGFEYAEVTNLDVRASRYKLDGKFGEMPIYAQLFTRLFDAGQYIELDAQARGETDQ